MSITGMKSASFPYSPSVENASEDAVELLHAANAALAANNKHSFWINALAIAMLVGMVLVTILDGSSQIDLEKILEFDNYSKLMEATAICLGFVFALAAVWLFRGARIIVDETGIYRVGSPVDELYGKPLNWSVAKSDITKIAFADNSFMNGGKLTLTFRSGISIILLPMQWRPPGQPKSPYQSLGALFKSGQALRQQYREAPLLKALQKFEYEIEFPESADVNSVSGFNLLMNPATRIATLGIFLMLLYAVWDYLWFGEEYVNGYPEFLLGLIGVTVGVIVSVACLSGRVPSAIAVGVGMVAMLAATTAAYPALLRVNALLDTSDLVRVEFLHKQAFVYRSTDLRWPDIEVPPRVHWNNPNISRPIIVPIRKGGIGFYQADFTELRRKR